MTETTDAAPVRVPNVTAGARSGIDHEVIGADAHEAYAINQDLASGQVTSDDHEPDDEPATLPSIPDDLTRVGDLLDWVHDPEADEGLPRALAVLVAERSVEKPRTTLVEPLERHVLDTILDGVVTASVTEVPDETPADPDAGPETSAAPSVVTTGAGEAVQIDGPTHEHIEGTAGAGQAVNAETGVVTGPGEPLPDALGQTSGTPLDPAQPETPDGSVNGSGQITTPDGTPIGDAPIGDAPA